MRQPYQQLPESESKYRNPVSPSEKRKSATNPSALLPTLPATEDTPDTSTHPSKLLWGVSAGTAFFGAWALALVNASQLNKAIIDWGKYEDAEELWKSNYLLYLLLMGVLTSFLASGFTGFQYDWKYNQKHIKADAITNLPKLMREHVAAAFIIMFTAITEGLVLAGCIKDFFSGYKTSSEQEEWEFVVMIFFSIVGAIQYTIIEGGELINTMSLKGRQDNSEYKNFLKTKGRKRYLYDAVNYLICLLGTGGFLALALVESNEILDAVLNYFGVSEAEAEDWSHVLCVPLSLIYTGMYWSLYGHGTKTALENWWSEASDWTDFRDKFRKNFMTSNVTSENEELNENSNAVFKNLSRILEKIKKLNFVLIAYSSLCVISAVSEGIVLKCSIDELLGFEGFGYLFLLVGFIQSILVEGVRVLKEQLGFKDVNPPESNDISIYPPKKFSVDLLQIAFLVGVRLVIESLLLPEEMEVRDITATSTICAYIFSSIASLLSTYLFSEIPRYRSLLLNTHLSNRWEPKLDLSNKNSDKLYRSYQKRKNFVVSKYRIVVQTIAQLLIPSLMGYMFEHLFYYEIFKNEQVDEWKALNNAQIVSSIVAGVVSVLLKRGIDNADYFKQKVTRFCNSFWKDSPVSENPDLSRRSSSSEYVKVNLTGYTLSRVQKLIQKFFSVNKEIHIEYRDISQPDNNIINSNTFIVFYDQQIPPVFSLLWKDKNKDKNDGTQYFNPTLDIDDEIPLGVKNFSPRRNNYPHPIHRRETGPYVVEVIRCILEKGKVPVELNTSSARQEHEEILSWEVVSLNEDDNDEKKGDKDENQQRNAQALAKQDDNDDRRLFPSSSS